MAHLFVYGTLMSEEIMRQVTGVCPQSDPAVLEGFSRRAVRGEPYPGILPEEGSRVEGVLYRDVPEASWERLDRFEGAMYERRSVQVELIGGSVEKAAAYVVRPEYRHYLDRAGWDFEEFLNRGIARFQGSYPGYRHLD